MKHIISVLALSIMAIPITSCANNSSVENDQKTGVSTKIETSNEEIKLVRLQPPSPLPLGVKRAYPMAKLEGQLVIKKGCLQIGDAVLIFPHNSFIQDESYPQSIVIPSQPEVHTVRVNDHVSFSGRPIASLSEEIMSQYQCGSKAGWVVNPIHSKNS